MSLQELANLGEFLGGIAVIASLLYLGLQIRQGNRQVEQNTRSLQLSSHQAIVGDLNQFRFRGLMQILFSNMELQHRNRTLGLYDLDAQDRTLLGVATAPGARAWWSQARYLYDSGFQRYVDELPAANELPTA